MTQALLALVMLAAPVGEPGNHMPPIRKLAWLAGCWEQEEKGRTVHEQWMAPLGGSMLGMSRTVADGKTVSFEAMGIHEDQGKLVFTANPSGQEQASFTQSELTDSMIVFSNPKHDFPQRIIYRLRPDGTLNARIEGTRNGALKGVDFPMRRGRCPGPTP